MSLVTISLEYIEALPYPCRTRGDEWMRTPLIPTQRSCVIFQITLFDKITLLFEGGEPLSKLKGKYVQLIKARDMLAPIQTEKDSHNITFPAVKVFDSSTGSL